MMNAGRGMKNRIKMILTASTIAIALCSTVPVHAEGRTYEVVFRAGSHGTVNEGESDTLNIPYGQEKGVTTTTDSNKVRVEEKDGYYFTGWSPDVEETVTKKSVYVAQYARLVDEVDYRVNFVDTNGVAVATQKVGYCNKKDTHSEQAPDIDGYIVDERVKSVVVEKSGTEITFVYTSTVEPNEETITRTNTVTVPGGTTTNTVTVPGTTPATTPAATPAATPAPETTPETPAQEAPQDTTTIPEEQTPLAGGTVEDNGDANQDTTTIEDEEVPLASKKVEKSNSKWIYSAIAGGAVLVLGAVALILSKRRKM